MLRAILQHAVVGSERAAGPSSIGSTSRAVHVATSRSVAKASSPSSRRNAQQSRKEKEERNEYIRRVAELSAPDPVLGHQINEDGESFWKRSELNNILLSKDEVWGVREDRRGNLITIDDADAPSDRNEERLGPKRMNFGLDSAEDRGMLFSDLPMIQLQDSMKAEEESGVNGEDLIRLIEEDQIKEGDSVNLLSRVLDLKNASGKGIQVENTRRIIEHFGKPGGERTGTDTGSVEVQVALLTYRIRNLYEHLDTGHRHDNQNRRSMILLVHKRARLLKYLKRKSLSRYEALLPRVGIIARAVEGEVVVPGKPRMKIAM